MKKMNNMWGGEYAAPALEVLDVNVENGFAASGFLNAASDDEYTQGAYENGEY